MLSCMCNLIIDVHTDVYHIFEYESHAYCNEALLNFTPKKYENKLIKTCNFIQKKKLCQPVSSSKLL